MLVPMRRLSAPLTGRQGRVIRSTQAAGRQPKDHQQLAALHREEDGTEARNIRAVGISRVIRLTKRQAQATRGRTRRLLSTLEAQPTTGSGGGTPALGGGNTTCEETRGGLQSKHRRRCGSNEFGLRMGCLTRKGSQGHALS